MSNCIVLNKGFTGSWLSDDSNIAHEIINFFRADDGNIYAYCAPHGQIPNKTNIDIKFLFITTQTQDNKCDLLYCFKIKKVLHSQCKFSHGINSETNNKKRRIAKEEINNSLNTLANENVTNFRRWEEITYGGISIRDLFVDFFEVYPVTFLVESVFKAKANIPFDAGIHNENEDSYNYQRNFGYVIEDDTKTSNAYNELIQLAPINIETGELKNEDVWDSIEPECFERMNINNPEDRVKMLSVRKNLFLDLIDNYKAEECYTKILDKIFKADSRLINAFVNNCVVPKLDERIDVHDEVFTPLTELGVSYGRIDNFAYSENFALIIENKVDAEFTMRKNGENQISQLKRYYDWANDPSKKFDTNNGEQYINSKNKIYVILSPDYRFEHISRKEEELREKEHFSKYVVVKYGELYRLIANWRPENFAFERYFEDIKLLFYRLSLTQDELYKAKLSEQLLSRNL